MKSALFASLIVGVCLTACVTANRVVLRDSSINLPGFTEKGEAALTARFGSSEGGGDNNPSLSGIDLEGAYAVSNRWTLLGNFSSRAGDYNGEQQSFGPYDYTQMHYVNYTWTTGVAYMYHINHSFYFAPSAGLGGGVFHIRDKESDMMAPGTLTDYYHDSRIFQGYIQPAFYIKGQWVSFAFGGRISFNKFGPVSTNYDYDTQSTLNLDGLQGATMNLGQFFILFRACPWTKAIRLEFQGGISDGLSSNTQHYLFDDLNFSTGISIDPYQWIKERKAHKHPLKF
jgi:hypothetical protein